MKKVIRVNEVGIFVEDVILNDTDNTPEDCIEVDCEGGFYLPKWDGEKWVEGGSTPEIVPIEITPNQDLIDAYEAIAMLSERLALLEGGGV